MFWSRPEEGTDDAIAQAPTAQDAGWWPHLISGWWHDAA